ncbi:uncharacterized protein LOC120571417 isoform X2 [Perca fluviatilis]|uniref:uncharacterized protein LOC120571417 isoform X2 n=1 Tax=Perca fluviatilis TaxID=8168 RepID=UPI0019632FBE|nr:uncharacterized protein LOC120571417 isoform X2 [Perca fluviatilis]
MNLWLSAHFLVAGLFLSCSALTSEECQPLVTPLSLVDPSMMYGRSNFLVGYVDRDIYRGILKTTESSWMNFTASPSANEVVMSQTNKIRQHHLCVPLPAELRRLSGHEHQRHRQRPRQVRYHVETQRGCFGGRGQRPCSLSVRQRGDPEGLGPGTFQAAGKLPRLLRRARLPL